MRWFWLSCFQSGPICFSTVTPKSFSNASTPFFTSSKYGCGAGAYHTTLKSPDAGATGASVGWAAGASVGFAAGASVGLAAGAGASVGLAGAAVGVVAAGAHA